MKRTLKIILSLACVVALVASLGIGALAVTDEEFEQLKLDTQRALDAQAIQNVMSWHVMYHCYGEHRAEMENIWVQEYENQATASFGQNQGFYVGYGSIWEAYVEGHDTSWLTSAKKYLSNNDIDYSDMTDDEILAVYGGVGQLLLHVTTTAIIEVAADGKTAKAFWYSPGMIAESGMNANTIWEAYGVDFVKEGNEWKMWHLHMFTDFMGSFYMTLGGSSKSGTAVSSNGAQQQWNGESGSQVAAAQGDFTEVDEFLKHEYLSSPQYSEFSSNRLRSQMEIFLPVQYETYSFDDGNYGPTVEEYESLGIDLDAWYAAHGYDVPSAEPADASAEPAGAADEDGYKAYLKEWVAANPAVQANIDEFNDAIDAGAYGDFPLEMCFTDQWFGFAAMSLDEFIAAGGAYEIPAFDPNLAPD